MSAYEYVREGLSEAIERERQHQARQRSWFGSDVDLEESNERLRRLEGYYARPVLERPVTTPLLATPVEVHPIVKAETSEEQQAREQQAHLDAHEKAECAARRSIEQQKDVDARNRIQREEAETVRTHQGRRHSFVR